MSQLTAPLQYVVGVCSYDRWGPIRRRRRRRRRRSVFCFFRNRASSRRRRALRVPTCKDDDQVKSDEGIRPTKRAKSGRFHRVASNKRLSPFVLGGNDGPLNVPYKLNIFFDAVTSLLSRLARCAGRDRLLCTYFSSSSPRNSWTLYNGWVC